VRAPPPLPTTKQRALAKQQALAKRQALTAGLTLVFAATCANRIVRSAFRSRSAEQAMRWAAQAMVVVTGCAGQAASARPYP